MFLAVRLEHHIEVTLEIKPSFLGRRVHLGKHVKTNVLEDVLASKVLLQQAKVLLALIDEVDNDFEHT